MSVKKNPQLKIGIVCPYNFFKPGGVQEHVKYQAEVLRKRGHEVTIITPRPRKYENELPPEGIEFLGGSARIKAPHATSADVSVTVDPESLDAALAKAYDVIHVHEPLVPIMPRQLLSKATCLKVGTFHAALPGNVLGKSLAGSYKAYARSVLPYIDIMTAVSPAAVGYVIDAIDNPSDINYISNGIMLKKFTTKKIERNRNQILYIGRLEKRKGALYAIKAFEKLKERKPDIELIICGDGPQRNSLRQFVERYGIEDVSFMGYISDEDKEKFLQTCGVFTTPALYGESFGIVLAEAMAYGAPIVAHKNDGYSWVMQGTGRLSLVDVHDIEAYADRLELLLEDDELRQAWQEWAKAYVKQFDYERVVDKYESLYFEALK